jgi:hypothetical protein
MKEVSDFLSGHEEIYARFRRDAELVKKEGVKPDPHMNINGYLVSLVHPEWINERIFAFSKIIGDYVPAVVQPSDTLHTTLGVNNMAYDGSTSISLCDIVRAMDRIGVEIHYPNWLYNPTTVIVEGHPTDKNVFNSLAYGLQTQSDIKLNPPWGSHITAVRFLEKKGPEEVAELFSLMEKAPAIGESVPTHIKVGTRD